MARPKKGEEKGATAGIAARIPEALRARLDGVAESKGTSLSDEIVSALEAHCDRFERAAEKKGRK